MSSSRCLNSNSDIAGIGVRIAIYAQAILTLAQPLVAGSDGWIDTKELKDLRSIYLNILLPASALVFATIIQARTFGLSAYHATVVLNLCWINNTSALIFFAFVLIALPGWIARQKAEAQSEKAWEYHRKTLEAMWPNEGPYAILKVDRLDRMRRALESARALNNELERRNEEEELENRVLEKETEWVKEWIETKERSFQIWEVQEDEIKSIRDIVWDSVRKMCDEGDKPETEIGKELHEETCLSGGQVNLWDVEASAEQEVQLTSRKFKLSKDFLRVVISNFCRKPVLIMAALASLHFTFFASFGFWFWLTLGKFGSDHDCIPFININAFGKTIPITSPTFRILSMFIYIIGLLPVINIMISIVLWFIFIFSLQLVISWVRPKRSRSDPSHVAYFSGIYFGNYSPHDARRFFNWAVFVTFLLQLWFVICTELTIKDNQYLLMGTSLENDWTLGQTLSMVLLVLPLINVFTSLWKLSACKLRERQSKGTEI